MHNSLKLTIRSTLAAFVAVLAISLPAFSTPMASGKWESSQLGYAGCLRGDTADFYACIIAYETEEGVRVVVRGRSTFTPIGPSGLYGSYIEDVTVSADSLQVFQPQDRNVPGIKLVADLPVTGQIDIQSLAPSDLYYASGSIGACSGYRAWWRGQSDTGAGILTHTDDTGTVGGFAIREYSACNIYWGEAVSGVWMMSNF